MEVEREHAQRHGERHPEPADEAETVHRALQRHQAADQAEAAPATSREPLECCLVVVRVSGEISHSIAPLHLKGL